MSIKIKVEGLRAGQLIEFETKSNTTFDGTHQVEIVGFLDVGHGIHDVVVREKHFSHSLLGLLSEYDSNFYQCKQEWIGVSLYKWR